MALGAALRSISAQEAPRAGAAARADTVTAADTTASVDTASVRCDGLVVSEVEVNPQRPAFRGNLARWRRVARAIGLHHTTTRPAIVRRFVTLGPDGACSEFRRAESERILRAQPYLSSARVRTVDDGAGGARVEVETVDEAPALIGGRLRHGRIAEISLGNENLFGRAVRIEAFGENGFAYRNGAGLSLTHHQLFGRPYTLTLLGEQRPVGDEWRVEAGHSFLTDLQRIAWHAGGTGRHDYLSLRRREDVELALPAHFGRWDAGGVLRFGRPGARLGLVGGVLAGERVTTTPPVLVTDTGFVTPDDSLTREYPSFTATRISIVTGFRQLRFKQARGLDALTAVQDIARGMQLGLIVGRALHALGSDEDDVLVSADLFAGLGGPWSYAALRLEGEARRPLGVERWDGVIGSGRAAWYLKETPRLTLILGAEGAGAWNARLPVSLTLADRDVVRGLPRDVAAVGARRVVLRAEQRWASGGVKQGDLGLAAFADVGRLWAGELPLGQEARAASVGMSLLAALPRGSHRLWRVDIAMPVQGAPSRVQVNLVSEVRTRLFWQEPEKISRARSSSGLAQIFSWP